MNPALLFQLLPLAGRLQKGLATIQRVEADPDLQHELAELPKAIALVRKYEADPDITDAIAVFEEAAGILAKTRQQDATGIQGGQ